MKLYPINHETIGIQDKPRTNIYVWYSCQTALRQVNPRTHRRLFMPVTFLGEYLDADIPKRSALGRCMRAYHADQNTLPLLIIAMLNLHLTRPHTLKALS